MDDEQYTIAHYAGLSGRIGDMIAAVAGLPAAALLKLIVDLRNNPASPATPPGGWTPTWAGLRDGLKEGGLALIAFADGSDSGTTIEPLANGGVVLAAGGGDVVKLGKGSTLADGGAGNDTASYALATPSEPSEADVLTGVAAFLTTGEAYHAGGRDALIAIENVIGSTGSDALVGDADANHLEGGGGPDFLFGGHWDGIQPTGDDVLIGGGGDDGLWGFDGKDTLEGGDGSDGLLGGAGDDTMRGGGGADFLFGGGFTTAGVEEANSGSDLLDGGNENDGLWGFDGDDFVSGGEGDDYIDGGSGNDEIDGGGGADTILGGAGDDSVNGGKGFDYLYGGAGRDIFFFSKGDSYDTIWDFSKADGDKIYFDAALGPRHFGMLNKYMSGFTHEGVDYTVFNYPDSIDQLTVKGVNHDDWTADMTNLPELEPDNRPATAPVAISVRDVYVRESRSYIGPGGAWGFDIVFAVGLEMGIVAPLSHTVSVEFKITGLHGELLDQGALSFAPGAKLQEISVFSPDDFIWTGTRTAAIVELSNVVRHGEGYDIELGQHIGKGFVFEDDIHARPPPPEFLN